MFAFADSSMYRVICVLSAGATYSQGVPLALHAAHGGPSSGHLTCRCLQVRQPLRDLGCERRGGITQTFDTVHVSRKKCVVTKQFG